MRNIKRFGIVLLPVLGLAAFLYGASDSFRPTGALSYGLSMLVLMPGIIATTIACGAHGCQGVGEPLLMVGASSFFWAGMGTVVWNLRRPA